MKLIHADDLSKNIKSSYISARKTGGLAGEHLDTALGLGDLARLTIHTEASALQNDPNSTREDYRKTWSIKYTLRSHFDSVRCVAFHPTDQMVVTGSEDHTLKLWNLAKCAPQSSKKNSTPEFEPVYTFRAHLYVQSHFQFQHMYF